MTKTNSEVKKKQSDEECDVNSFISTITIDNNILSTLLETGSCQYTTNVNIDQLNKIMFFLSYEAVLWYDKSEIVLKDIFEDFESLYAEKKLEEAKLIFTEIAIGKKVFPNTFTKELEENNWIKDEGDMKYSFTKRAMVQFSKFITTVANTKYKKCCLCNLLVEDNDYHVYCKSLLNKAK